LKPSFENSFPNFTFENFAVVDGNVLIQDCLPEIPESKAQATNNKINQLLNSKESKVTFQLVDGNTMTSQLLELIERIDLNKHLILFPGNGAMAVKKYLESVKPDFSTGINFPVSRVSLGKGRYQIDVRLPRILPSGFSKILIIDDVIASGLTMKAVISALSKKLGVLPPTSIATWMMLSVADIPDNYYQAGYAVWGLKGNACSRPPINSLSCFLDETEKYKLVQLEYGKKFFIDQKTLDQIRAIIKGGET
jgi:hypothetical protein